MFGKRLQSRLAAAQGTVRAQRGRSCVRGGDLSRHALASGLSRRAGHRDRGRGITHPALRPVWLARPEGSKEELPDFAAKAFARPGVTLADVHAALAYAAAGDTGALEALTSALRQREADGKQPAPRRASRPRGATVPRHPPSSPDHSLATSALRHAGAYIRKMPQLGSGMGAFAAAARPRARTRRVSIGSITPSSQRRAVLK